MAADVDLRLCLPRDAASVRFVRGVCRDVLHRLEVDADCQAEVLLALSEACNNVVLHAMPSDQYEVSVEISEGRCSLRVIDAGAGFDGHVSRGRGGELPEESGRGVVPMRALVDAIAFEARPEAGTIVHLVKTLSFCRRT